MKTLSKLNVQKTSFSSYDLYIYKFRLTWNAASLLLIFSDRTLPFYNFLFIKVNYDVVFINAVILIYTSPFYKNRTVAVRASLIDDSKFVEVNSRKNKSKNMLIIRCIHK